MVSCSKPARRASAHAFATGTGCRSRATRRMTNSPPSRGVDHEAQRFAGRTDPFHQRRRLEQRNERAEDRLARPSDDGIRRSALSIIHTLASRYRYPLGCIGLKSLRVPLRMGPSRPALTHDRDRPSYTPLPEFPSLRDDALDDGRRWRDIVDQAGGLSRDHGGDVVVFRGLAALYSAATASTCCSISSSRPRQRRT